MITLRDGQVSTETRQNPIIIYERINNREESPNLNKKIIRRNTRGMNYPNRSSQKPLL